MLKNKKIIILVVIVAFILIGVVIGFLFLRNTEKSEIEYINSSERRYK